MNSWWVMAQTWHMWSQDAAHHLKVSAPLYGIFIVRGGLHKVWRQTQKRRRTLRRCPHLDLFTAPSAPCLCCLTLYTQATTWQPEHYQHMTRSVRHRNKLQNKRIYNVSKRFGILGTGCTMKRTWNLAKQLRQAVKRPGSELWGKPSFRRAGCCLTDASSLASVHPSRALSHAGGAVSQVRDYFRNYSLEMWIWYIKNTQKIWPFLFAQMKTCIYCSEE